MIKTKDKCPLCDKPLYELEKDYGVIVCDTVITLPSGKTYHHYIHDLENNWLSIYILPYKLSYRNDTTRVLKLRDKEPIKKRRGTRSSLGYFKGLFTCPTIKPDREDKLLQRIKLLLTLS